MISFSNPHIVMASVDDAEAIKELLNSAYRGEASKQGWTTEAHLIAGNQRIDISSLKEVMQQTNSVFLKYTDGQQITGCVNLQQHDKKLYLDMFSVLPVMQGSGIGKQLLKAAEEYALHLQCNSVYMSVITVRAELIEWYERHGYTDTGERKIFVEDLITGKHLQPLAFMMLEKKLV